MPVRLVFVKTGGNEDKEIERHLRVEQVEHLLALSNFDRSKPFALEHSPNYWVHDRFMVDRQLRRSVGLHHDASPFGET
jgi:hypothetical protein